MNDWKNRSHGTDMAHNLRVHWADKAKENSCWIYHKLTKKWFTPEEFVFDNQNVRVDAHGRNNMHEYEIKDPRIGLEDGYRVLKKATAHVDELSRRIWEYYDLKMKPKKTIQIKK